MELEEISQLELQIAELYRVYKDTIFRKPILDLHQTICQAWRDEYDNQNPEEAQ